MRNNPHNVLSAFYGVLIAIAVLTVSHPATLQAAPRGALPLNRFFIFLKGFSMQQNHSPPRNSFDDINWDPQITSLDPELAAMIATLKRRGLLAQPLVQWLVRSAVAGCAQNKPDARKRLTVMIEAIEQNDVRSDDAFRPLAPRNLLDSGSLHLFDQTNSSPWRIDPDVLTRGVLLCGPQGGGKSRFLVYLCKQLATLTPPVPFFILDPKGALKDWADYLDATYVDIEDIRIDVSPPPGLSYEQFLTSLMPQTGDLIGSIYGIEILQQAAGICRELRSRYIHLSGKRTELSLQDIHHALPLVKDASKGRRVGYRDGVSTGLGRILDGSGELYRCRKGVDLATLFNNNVILGCRSITDDFAARFLVFYLLFWIYEAERYAAPSDRLKRVLVLDDATQFLSMRIGFESGVQTSPFTNIYARLRSSGNGVIATTQTPHLADSGILALSHTVICIGSLHYGKDTRLLAEMMGLNDAQRDQLCRLENREAVGVSIGSPWKQAVHGFTCDVSDVHRGHSRGQP